MNCPNCNAANNPGAKFCLSCGMKLPQTGDVPVMKQEPDTIAQYHTEGAAAQYSAAPVSGNPRASGATVKKRSGAGKILIAVFVVILAAVALKLTFLKDLSFGGSSGRSDLIEVFSTEDGLAFNTSGTEKNVLDDDGTGHFSYSLDGSKVVALTDRSDDNTYELWYIDAKGRTKVDDDVSVAVISDNGNTVAYIKDPDMEESEGTLYTYDTAGKKSTKVEEDVYSFTDDGILTISPDGKALTYLKKLDRSGNEVAAYVKIGGKDAEKFGENKVPLAISDTGKYIYYLDVDTDTQTADFNLKKGEENNRLLSDISLENGSQSFILIFNNDYHSVIFGNDGKTYVSKDGADKEKIASNMISQIIFPQFTNFKRKKFSSESDMLFVTVDTKSFDNVIAILDNSDLISYSSKEGRNTIAGNVSCAFINENADYIFYASSNDLKKRKLSGNDKVIDVADQTAGFVVSPDGGKVYTVNFDKELEYISGKSKPEKIADDVEPNSLYLSKDGSRAYFLTDVGSDGGELCYSKNGGKKVKLAEDVSRVVCYGNDTFYLAGDDSSYDMYKSTGGKKFVPYLEDVSGIFNKDRMAIDKF